MLAIPGEEAEAINMAIDCVGQAEDNKLTEDLVRFLMGDKDGVPKVLKIRQGNGRWLPAAVYSMIFALQCVVILFF